MNIKDLKYLNEISYGYWKSQVLFVAVEMGLFTFIKDTGKSCKDVTSAAICSKILRFGIEPP